MSEKTSNGCALWISLAMTALVFVVGGYTLISNAIPSSDFISPTSNPTLIVTIESPQADTPFVVEDNQITYIYRSTLGNPCYYVIAGRVLNLANQSFTDFVVNIKMLGELAPEEPGYAFPGEGSTEDGPSGWSSLLPQWHVDYEIWLTTKIGGAELSPHILVETKDCDHNKAIVNFVQVKPSP